MRERLPNLTHPMDEYLTEGAQLLSQDRNPSAVGNSSSPHVPCVLGNSAKQRLTGYPRR